MINHHFDFSWRDCPVEDDGVPVLLVHVIARLNRFVAFPQLDGSFRVAFEVYRLRMNIEREEKKYLLMNLENEDIFSKRKAFRDLPAFLEAVLTESVDGQRSTFPSLQQLTPQRLSLLALTSQPQN